MMGIKHWFGWVLWGLIGLGTCFSQSDGIVDILSHNTTSFRSRNTGSQMVLGLDGEVITGWRSAREGLSYTNIYIQKLDEKGNPTMEMDGTPVCPFPANQDNFQMVSDHYGGVIVIWEDSRNGSDYSAIYAQRINLKGESLWGKGGLRICSSSGAQRNPRISSDNKQGFFILWEDSRTNFNEYDLYGQHIDLGGRLHWRKTGMPICTAPNVQQNVSMKADSSGHLFVIWEDFRNGVYWNLFGQKIDRAGNLKWKPSGLDIFAGVEENHHEPDIVPDDRGGMLFVYQKYSSTTRGTDIYRGRLNSEGELLFHYATCFSQDEQLNPLIIKKGSKAILVWEDRRHGNWDIYGQMIRLGDGILEWGINGISIVKTGVDERYPVLIGSTTYNYQVFAWLARGEEGDAIRVQKMNNLGEAAWNPAGIVVSNASKDQFDPAIIADEQGGLFCSWSDRRNKRFSPIQVQHLDGEGKAVFTSEGARLGGNHAENQADIRSIKVLATLDDHFFVAWEDLRNGVGNSDIYLQKVDANGHSLWRNRGVPVCHYKGDQSQPYLVDDGVGGVIVTWSDQRHGKGDDIYAQRINRHGKRLWSSSGVKVCDAASSQSQVRGVSDGKEGALLAWVDARSLKTSGFDLYIQRINYAGELLWARNGKPFVDLPGLQTSPDLASDGTGGAYIAWMDYRGANSNIYAQHVNQFGMYQWEREGRCLVPMENNQRHPVMVRNFEHDLYLVWQEERFGNPDAKLFMQCLTPSGIRLWEPSGLRVCRNNGEQSFPDIVTDAYGNLWVSWLDSRYDDVSGTGLYIQKFEIGGDEVWTSNGIQLGERITGVGDYSICLDQEDRLMATWVALDPTTEKEKVHFQIVTPDGNSIVQETLISNREERVDQSIPSIKVNESGGGVLIFREKGRKFRLRLKKIG